MAGLVARRIRTGAVDSGVFGCARDSDKLAHHDAPIQQHAALCTRGWNALKSCGIEHEHIHLLITLYKDQEATVLTDEESDMVEIKKGTKRVTLCQDCSSTLFCRKPWKKTFHVGKRKEEWVSAWETTIMTASQI